MSHGKEGPQPGAPAPIHNTILFLIIALVASVLGFGVVAGTAALIAEICFAIFLVMFLVSLFLGKRGKVR